jgi:hypothetical protein
MNRNVEFETHTSRFCVKEEVHVDIAKQTEQKAKWLQMKQRLRAEECLMLVRVWVLTQIYKMYEYMRKEENETAKRSETLSPCCDIMRRIPVLRFIFLFDMINGEGARSHHLKELML